MNYRKNFIHFKIEEQALEVNEILPIDFIYSISRHGYMWRGEEEEEEEEEEKEERFMHFPLCKIQQN